MKHEQHDQLGTDPCQTKEIVLLASTGDFCFHIFSCHWDDSLLLNYIFSNFKLMSLFASFHTSQTHFSFFFRELPHPFFPPKSTWHLFHQYIPRIFRKGPGEEVGLTPWPLLLSWTLVLSEPTFRVFSSSLKFTVVQGRHQRRLFALLTRCRPHSIIHNMVYCGEISRPPSLSLRGSL